MNTGEFVSDFIAANLEKIFAVGVRAYGKADEVIKVNLKTAYSKYLTVTRNKYSTSKSFFIRHESVDLYSYYVSTGIACGNTVLDQPGFRECIELKNRIVVTGTGGCGKSVLLKHLFLDCIKDKEYMPVIIELRDLNVDKQNLDECITKTLSDFQFNVSKDYFLRAKEAGHIAFFFDGYDEVNLPLRKKLISQIRQLSRKYTGCPIFITSRPDETFDGIDEFSIFNVLPLNIDTAIALIEKLPFDEAIKGKFINDLRGGLFSQHESFLSNPLLLSIMLLTYGENAEIPSKLSIFYNQAYEALFQRHDAHKGGYIRSRLTKLDIQDFSRVFSLFSLQTYEKGIFKMSTIDCLGFIEKSRLSLKKEFSSEDYLSDLLKAACLLVEDGLEVAFSHRSFQEYFVALHISLSPPDIQKKLIERYWRNMRSDNVMYLLLEINPELVESALIIPILSGMFKGIGVKNKVGVTHTARYFKKFHSTINIDSNRISADVRSDKATACELVHMVINHSDVYDYPGNVFFEAFKRGVHKKYGDGSNRKVYMADELTYRSPVLSDLLKGKGAFSVAYLVAAKKALDMLEEKHKNRVESLDELLGIS